ncbi:MAG: hypothetical protein HYV16_14265 [Gammaproteobacteria bacterium]|nr:hypothetical protein [Gammaproteobacteria bacterium]
MVRRLALGLAFCASLPAAASTVLGSPSCLDYHSAYADKSRELEAATYQAWLLGYLSGLARGSEMLAQAYEKEKFPGEYNVLNDARKDELFRLVDDFCRSHPDRKLHEAALRLFLERLDRQVDELSSPAPVQEETERKPHG